MIKPNELRLENLILNRHDEIDIVTDRTFQDFRYPKMSGDFGYKGIPLTLEILLKFGFQGNINETSNCGNFYLGYNAEHGNHKMALWHQKGSWCFSHTNRLTVLKYVHQLQNLYFAINDEELDFSSVCP